MNPTFGAAEPATRRERWTSRVTQAGFVLCFLALWYASTNYWGVSPILLPKPQLVLEELMDILRSGEYIGDLLVTLTEVIAAFAISMSLGLLVGFAVSLSPALVKVFEPLI